MESILNVFPATDSQGNPIYPNKDEDILLTGQVTDVNGAVLNLTDLFLEFQFKTSCRKVFNAYLNETPNGESDIQTKNAKLSDDGLTVSVSIPSNTFDIGGFLYTRIGTRITNTLFPDNYQHSFSEWNLTTLKITD